MGKAHQTCSTRGWRLWHLAIDSTPHQMNISPSQGINTLTLSSYLNLPKGTSTVLEKAESSFHGSFMKDAGRACKLAIKGALKSGELRRCDIGHPKHLLHMPNKGTDEAHQDGCPHPFKSESMGENICLPTQHSLLWGITCVFISL